jgi:ribonucleoside-diphosphate reductase alpha chain
MSEQQIAAQGAQDASTVETTDMTQLEGIRQKVFMDRYSLKDASGTPLEHYPEQLWARVARGIAEVEKTPEARAAWEKKFYETLADFQFVPGGRILAGAGSGHSVTFYNCFVIPSPEDSRHGILDNLKIMTEIMARGGGVGINLSTLRPRGSYIRTVNGTASGPCSWAQLYSVATGDVIQQGGCFGPNERIATDHGLIPAKELADRLDSGETIQAQTHKGWRPFTAVFRNGMKDLYEVTTSKGYHVQVTLDHKMGVQHNGEITTVSLRNLKEGDEILLLFGEGTKAEVYPDPISSITPRGPSEVFDFEVEEVHLLVANGIYTSNSRRGALMLMLDDNHPDVEEFITVKRTAGKIEHANLSVCISDAFMQAVKDDSDWKLVWDGEVKKTIRARSLWDLICTSAWESAEPGMVFMDRYNKLSNTWYYENIRCVNPCVTGDTLVSTEHGYMPARDLRIGMNVRTPAGLKPIEKMYNNGVQHIYRVDFSDGGYLKGTADHKVKVVRGKKYEWVPFSELKEGEKVLVVANETFGPRQGLPTEAISYIAKRELNVANFYDRKLGLAVGTVLGDGTLRELSNGNSHSYQCKVTFGVHEDNWYHTFNGLMADMNIHTHRTLAEKEFPVGGGSVAIKHASVRLECYKLASLLVRIGMIPNIKAPLKTIPIAFMSMEKEFLAGVLDGLFSTDGSVLIKQDNPLLRFHTSSNELAQQVRLLLLQFGIHGRIYRATRDEDLMYDGRSMYGTSEKFDVIIMNEGIARFYAEIGLSHPEKAARLKEIATNWHYIGGTWTASVVSVTDTGTEEEVYDLYEPETLTWITNGYCSFDCGEQGLPPFGVCNLGALNLSSFVQNGQMDYERLAEKTKVAMRFLDNVVDSTEYFIKENAEAQLGTRRTGLGTMGLADALIKMKIAYGSDESIPVIEKIYATIRDAAYEASADYAAEKGAFPRFERDKYMQGHFIKQLPKAIQEKIKKHGTRNAVLLTQAPTGTTSLLSGVSSGIEPVYDFAMIRRDRTGEHILYHPLLQEWREEHANETTPSYFVSSKDLTPEEHVRVQAMIQKYTDSSISKTVNAPNDHTVEQVQKLYRMAYEMGCKGITYYRDGSRDAVLTRVADEKKAEKKVEEQAVMLEPVTSIQQGIKPRPSVVQGYTRQVNAPEGKINVTINSDEHGPLEVFVNVGKAGSDIAALAEALGRLISLNLRVLSPLSQIDRAKEIAEQLRGIGGSRSVGFGAQQVRSMPDAVARALELHMTTLQQQAEDQLDNPPATSKANGLSNGHSDKGDTASQENNPLLLSKLSVTGNLCPECGCNTMVYEEGCKKCYSCGYSEC